MKNLNHRLFFGSFYSYMKKITMKIFLIVLSCLPVFPDIMKTVIDDAANVETYLKISRGNYACAFYFEGSCLLPAKSLFLTECLMFGKADFYDVLDCSFISGKYLNSEIINKKGVSVTEPGNYENFSVFAEKGCTKSGFFRFRNTDNFFIDIISGKISSGIVISDIHNKNSGNFYDYFLIKKTAIIRPYLNGFFDVENWKIYTGMMLNFSVLAAADVLMLLEVIYKSKHIDMNLKMCWWSEYFSDLSGECGLPFISWNTSVDFHMQNAVLGILSKGTILRHDNYQDENDCLYNEISLKMFFRENDCVNIRCSLELEKALLSKPNIDTDSEISIKKSFSNLNVFWKYRYSENYYEIETSMETGIDFKNGNSFSIEIDIPDNLVIKTGLETGNFSFSSDIILCRDNLSFSLSVSFKNQITDSI